MICMKCSGTGKYFGNGMMMTECNQCDGFGKLDREAAKPSVSEIDKRSKSYKTAINELMALNPKMSRNDAMKMFDETFEKL